jgi:ATP-dependent Clp protease ATP-binding subunit ClpX
MKGKGASIGFSADVRDIKDIKIGDVIGKIEPDDLVKYGLIPEFIGRLPIIAPLADLKEADLIKILTKPKNALVKQYVKLLKMEGVELSFSDCSLKALAAKAISRKTGARGLRAIMESILLDTMYELPNLSDAKKVVIKADVITKGASPTIVRGDKKPSDNKEKKLTKADSKKNKKVS